MKKLLIGLILVILLLVPVSCASAVEEDEPDQLLETKECVFGSIAILVPSDWYIQTKTEGGQVRRMLTSEADPRVEKVWAIGAPQEPLEGPLVELSYAVHYVMPNEYSSMTIAGVSEVIRVFQSFDGKRTVRLYYLPESNGFIEAKYQTSEERKLIDSIMSSLRIIESTESGVQH